MKMHVRRKIPNTITFFNLSLGVIAILLVVDNRGLDFVIPACLLILAAAFTDRFDGKIARMLDAETTIGKELDSLSDLISFGIAPIVLTWKTCFYALGPIGYIIALIFVVSGTYRLARFNVTETRKYFTGIPITLAGSFLILLNLYNCYILLRHHQSQPLPFPNVIITSLFTLLLSYLMISNIRINKK